MKRKFRDDDDNDGGGGNNIDVDVPDDDDDDVIGSNGSCKFFIQPENQRFDLEASFAFDE
jgi:hypothetical protein